MAAISTLAAIGGGLLMSALTRKHGQSGNPTAPTMPAAPDPAIAAMQKQEAAQRAASFARLRASAMPGGVAGVPANGVQGALTGPAGIPTPAPVQRQGLIGQ